MYEKQREKLNGAKKWFPPPAGPPANSTGPRLLAGEAERVTKKMTRRSTGAHEDVTIVNTLPFGHIDLDMLSLEY